MEPQNIHIYLATQQSFCGGVARALNTVEQTLDAPHGTVYITDELIHNPSINDSLKARGVKYLNEIGKKNQEWF